MRVIAFGLRARLVVGLAAGLVRLLDDGPPRGSTAAAAPVRHTAAHHGTAARRPPSGSFTFSAVGDVMMGSMPNLPADGGAGYFSGVASSISADVALGNLEGTLSTGGSS